MQYGPMDHPQSGVLIPLASVRSDRSLGIGEFPDLVTLAAWAAATGFDLLQILPIQDTGDDSSPYAARGAFCLHPIYLRLEDVEGSERVRADIEAARAELGGAAQVEYAAVLRTKRSLLHRIFEGCNRPQLWAQVAGFVEDNPWVRPHAIYQMLRRRFGDQPWWLWPELRDPDVEEVAALWNERSDALLFEVWIQYEADRQLRAATQEVDRLGVRIKGDLPILMSRDSSDVWFYRRFFDDSVMAGAPPDLYTESGQLWGFPCYRWDELARDDHRWWKQRLLIASRYYHALRIDHVLGFFRIWRVPATAKTAMLGIFDPSPTLHRDEFRQRGFDDATIDRLAGIGSDIPTEAELYDDSLETEEQIETLRPAWQQVLLPDEHDPDAFRFSWEAFSMPLFDALDDEQKDALHELARIEARRQEELWEATGRERLSILRGATDALICAEDLGATPDCVPVVLRELGLLGLRLERWIRDWDAEGQPFIPPSAYDEDSVCSPSTHDSSSLRGWWEEEDTDRQAYWRSMGKDGEAPATMDTHLLREVLERNLAARSKITILMMADLLALDPRLRPEDPDDERINLPGTPSEKNWRWRMPLSIEALTNADDLNDALREMTSRRRARG